MQVAQRASGNRSSRDQHGQQQFGLVILLVGFSQGIVRVEFGRDPVQPVRRRNPRPCGLRRVFLAVQNELLPPDRLAFRIPDGEPGGN